MIPLGTQSIHTNRLLLRQFTVNDASDMFTQWASDSTVVTFLTWPAYNNVADVRKKLEEWVDEYDNPLTFNWAIVYNDVVIGNISVVRLYEKTNSCEIGYALSRHYWGKGIMTEALESVIDYLFQQCDVNRIASNHDVNNPASGRVMQKAGLTYEGTLRQADRNNQGIVDMAVYSILKHEWEQNIPQHAK